MLRSMDWPIAKPLATSRLLLEPLAADHAREMVGILAPPELYEHTGDAPPSAQELSRRYTVQSVGHSPAGDAGWLNWIIRVVDTTNAVGYVQATVTLADEGIVADVAWLITPSAQGRGIASEAARAMLDWLRGQEVDVVRALIHPENHPSERVARRLGLSRSGSFEDGEAVWQLGGAEE